MKDSYIPAKQERSLRRYGFVRSWREVDARKSIQLFNSSTIREAKIRVCLARFDKGGIANLANHAFKQHWLSNSQQRTRKV